MKEFFDILLQMCTSYAQTKKKKEKNTNDKQKTWKLEWHQNMHRHNLRNIKAYKIVFAANDVHADGYVPFKLCTAVHVKKKWAGLIPVGIYKSNRGSQRLSFVAVHLFSFSVQAFLMFLLSFIVVESKLCNFYLTWTGIQIIQYINDDK